MRWPLVLCKILGRTTAKYRSVSGSRCTGLTRPKDPKESKAILLSLLLQVVCRLLPGRDVFCFARGDTDPLSGRVGGLPSYDLACHGHPCAHHRGQRGADQVPARLALLAADVGLLAHVDALAGSSRRSDGQGGLYLLLLLLRREI